MVERISKKYQKNNSQIGWIKQLEKVYAGGRAICPVCGDNSTEHSFYVFDNGVGYGDFYCSSCGTEEHLCRMRFPEDIKIKIKHV